MTNEPTDTSHPLAAERSRVERIADRYGDYWVLGFLGFLAPVISPVLGAFYLCFLLVPVAVVADFLTHSRDPGGWIETDEGGRLPEPGQYWTRFNPVVLLEMAGHGVSSVLVRGRGMAPEAGVFESEVSYRPPFDGEWTVLRGSTDREHAHSIRVPQHRYAHDFLITDESGATRDGDGHDGHCFGESVLAPADGTVVATADRDDGTGSWGNALYGNHVIIDHGDQYSLLAHLQAGSLTVSAGDTVEQGEQLGQCGSSGRATEPQLHMQVLDRANPYVGVALPIAFEDTAVAHPGSKPAEPERRYVHCGQTVSGADQTR